MTADSSLDFGVEWVNADRSTYISSGWTETSAANFVASYSAGSQFPQPVRALVRDCSPWRPVQTAAAEEQK